MVASRRMLTLRLRTARVLHTAFYKFADVADVEAVTAGVRALASSLTGGIIVAEEGISGVAAGDAEAVAAFEQALTSPEFAGGLFAGMAFKHSACVTKPFGRLKVSRKPEIVALGDVPDGPVDAHNALSPQAWREMITRDDVVVLDNRNSFEYRLGKFVGAVDPEVAHFRDFPGYIEAHAEGWKLQGKMVAMYCTGGVRCEKSSAWLSGLGLDVVYLDGGILNYFAEMPDAERDWQGECFVFDNRIALDTKLQETPTTAEQVYADEPDGPWRIRRANRLLAAVSGVVGGSEPAAAPHPNPLPVKTGRGKILGNSSDLQTRSDGGNALSPSSYGERAEVGRRLADEPRLRGGHLLGPAAGASPRPPTRDGVGPSSVTVPGTVTAWPSVIDFLSSRFASIPRATWAARMADRRVIDAAGALITEATPARPHMKVFYYRDIAAEPRIPFDETVLFQDELLVVADKPHFLPVIPSGRYVQETLLTRLKRRLGLDTLTPIHRIDMDTAGLVVFSVSPKTRDAYHRLFRQRDVEKIYEAIAPVLPAVTLPLTRRSRLVESDQFMQMREEPGESNAETHIDVLETQGGLARYILRPRTGQKHQLRAHMAALGVPIVNDRLYPVIQPYADTGTGYSSPLQLLAKSIAFIDPITGQDRRFDSAQTLMIDPQA
jgi:tRNA pseudouridine32 synthase / 23S rRNA pseudouridine746 synthase